MVVIADILQLNRHRVPLALLRIPAIRRDRRTLHYLTYVTIIPGACQSWRGRRSLFFHLLHLPTSARSGVARVMVLCIW